jgi:hypothetical protein
MIVPFGNMWSQPKKRTVPCFSVHSPLLGSTNNSVGIVPVKKFSSKLNSQTHTLFIGCMHLPALVNHPNSDGIIPISWFLYNDKSSERNCVKCLLCNWHNQIKRMDPPSLVNRPSSIGIILTIPSVWKTSSTWIQPNKQGSHLFRLATSSIT